jgi:hypothetical protein
MLLKSAKFARRNAWTMVNGNEHYAAIWLNELDWTNGIDLVWEDHGRFQGAKDQVEALRARLDADGYTYFIAVKKIDDVTRKHAIVRGKLESASTEGGAHQVKISELQRIV